MYSSGNYDRLVVDDVMAILSEITPDEHVDSGRIVLEIGANIGTQTIYFCKSDSVGHVLAVEPDPRNLELLRRNIESNKLDDMVDVIPFAIGDVSELGHLYRSKTNYGGSSLIQRHHDDAVQVKIRPLDSILDESGIQEGQISLIWMDIEGAEPAACRSMTRLLERRVPFMMEFSPMFYGPDCTRDFVAFLCDFYDRCMVYEENGRNEILVRNLPVDIDQTNILLLP